MNQIKTQAIILRRTNYGEADRILNLLTPEGKISAIAKGVRKSKSKLAGGLELFAVSDINIMTKQGSEIGLLTSARLIRFYGSILKDYNRMQLGYEFVKHINKATETVADPEFFELLKDSFEYLDNLAINYMLIELWFYLQLSAELGEGLNLKTDIEGRVLAEDKRYSYDFESRAFYEHHHGVFTGDHIKVLRLVLNNNPAKLSQVGGLEKVLTRELIDLLGYQKAN